MDQAERVEPDLVHDSIKTSDERPGTISLCKFAKYYAAGFASEIVNHLRKGGMLIYVEFFFETAPKIGKSIPRTKVQLKFPKAIYMMAGFIPVLRKTDFGNGIISELDEYARRFQQVFVTEAIPIHASSCWRRGRWLYKSCESTATIS